MGKNTTDWRGGICFVTPSGYLWKLELSEHSRLRPPTLTIIWSKDSTSKMSVQNVFKCQIC